MLENRKQGAPALTFDHTRSQFGPEMVQTEGYASSADDFRSVIDDLTIENKKLRERLRKYETLSSARLEKDKLFEVKIHGLTPQKKRELEETLQAFASSIRRDDSTNTSTSQLALRNATHPDTSTRHVSKLPSSSSTSNSRLVDSAYASLSTSGPISSSASNPVDIEKKDRALTAKSKMGKVQSFLDDIPQGLLPKHSAVMTERGKKKLVVRRLEQLFTGKLRVPGGQDSQPLQQQEVSNSAARDDRRAIESRGQEVSAEGVREAHILPEIVFSKPKAPRLPGDTSGESSTTSQADGVDRTSSSPDQRPTRPLDLDPDRAQVPAENLEYIRHLGLSTPTMTSGESTNVTTDTAENDGDGWIYLNLLINMAQLHMINVTPDFIRSAVAELSTKFQLSRDGRKLRWMGGNQGTELSSDSGADNPLRDSPNDSDSLQENDKKRRKVDLHQHQDPFQEEASKDGRFSPIALKDLAPATLSNDARTSLHYKPLFFSRLRMQDDEMSLDESISHVSFAPVDESAKGRTPNRLRRSSHSVSSSKRRRNDGIIAFYSQAPFCTDLSGDRQDVVAPLQVTDVDMEELSNHANDALGFDSRPPPPSRTPSGSLLKFRPFKDYSICADGSVREGLRCRTPEPVAKENADDDFNFSPEWTEPSAQKDFTPLNFDASGLGGTQPADHFAVTVETVRPKLDGRARVRLSKFSKPGPKTERFLHNVSQSSLDIFRSSDTDENIIPGATAMCRDSSLAPRSATFAETPLKIKILSTRVYPLKPSKLPPPVTYHGALASSTENSDDTSSDDSEVFARFQRRSLFDGRALSASPDNPADVEESNHEVDDSPIDDADSFSIDMHADELEDNTTFVTAGR